MKRLDLVQLTFIIIGLISAFFCLRLTGPFLLYCFSWFSDGLKGGYVMQAFIGNIIMLATYLMFSIYTIKNSKPLAEWIGNRASLQGDINFALNKTESLFALFLGLGIFGLIDEIPSLLSGLYDHIQDNNNYSLDLDLLKPRKDLLITQAVKTALFLILVIYARTFAEYFSSKINNVEPEDEINSKTD